MTSAKKHRPLDLPTEALKGKAVVWLTCRTPACFLPACAAAYSYFSAWSYLVYLLCFLTFRFKKVGRSTIIMFHVTRWFQPIWKLSSLSQIGTGSLPEVAVKRQRRFIWKPPPRSLVFSGKIYLYNICIYSIRINGKYIGNSEIVQNSSPTKPER